MLLAPTLLLNAGSGAAIARPTFSRDFAGEKTLNNGTGPAITFTRASNATFFDANGTLQTASNDAPRFDHSGGSSLGLLIEEARTNSIPNSETTGAATGTQGTPPTGWNVLTHVSQGLNRTITTGSTGGFNYIDVRYAGTITGGNPITLFMDPQATNAGYVAANGQTWTASGYFALVAGSLPAAGLDLVCRGRATDGTATGDQQLLNFTPTSTLTRYTATRTFSNASTTRITLDIRVTTIPDGTAVDFTLRIAAPQLEQGAFPTSYIPTTTAAATRSADSAVVTPISSFYNQAEGTLFAEFQGARPAASMVDVSDQTFSNRLALARLSGGTLAAFGRNADALILSIEIGAAPSITDTIKFAGAFKSDDFQAARGGTLGTADTSGAMPTVTHMRVGSGGNGTAFANGHIRKIAYWPRRLSNTLLQQLTT
jgi:hypothetical protein